MPLNATHRAFKPASGANNMLSVERHSPLSSPPYWFKHLRNDFSRVTQHTGSALTCTPTLLLTCGQGALLGGRLLAGRRLRRVNKGVTDGADDDPVLLHFSPQAVEESLRRVLRRSIWQVSRTHTHTHRHPHPHIHINTPSDYMCVAKGVWLGSKMSHSPHSRRHSQHNCFSVLTLGVFPPVCKLTLWQDGWNCRRLREFDFRVFVSALQGTNGGCSNTFGHVCAVTGYSSVTQRPPTRGMRTEFVFCLLLLQRVTWRLIVPG